jgi:hypothetical protein
MPCCGATKRRQKLIPGKAAEKDMVEALAAAGQLPIFAIPRVDIDGDNHIKQVFIAEYEGGLELSVIFADEDRPSKISDCIYDMIRAPLFGRSEDIETLYVNLVKGDGAGGAGAVPGSVSGLEFPGTYAADFTWASAAPRHGTATVLLQDFEQRESAATPGCKGPVVWVNTWSHLFGEKNANPAMEMVFCSAAASEGRRSEPWPEHLYPVYIGSRAEVDSKFKGLVSSFAKTMSGAKRKTLGRRTTRSKLGKAVTATTTQVIIEVGDTKSQKS